MCAPALLAMGTVLSAGSSVMQGMAASRAGKMQAAIMDSNAKVVAARGQFEEGRIRDQLDKVLAGQTAYYAASGLDPTQGSPIAVAAASAAQGEVDAVLARQKGQADSEGMKLAADQARAQAKQAMFQGVFGAATTLLSGAYRWSTLGGASTAGNSVGGQISLANVFKSGGGYVDDTFAKVYS